MKKRKKQSNWLLKSAKVSSANVEVKRSLNPAAHMLRKVIVMACHRTGSMSINIPMSIVMNMSIVMSTSIVTNINIRMNTLMSTLTSILTTTFTPMKINQIPKKATVQKNWTKVQSGTNPQVALAKKLLN